MESDLEKADLEKVVADLPRPDFRRERLDLKSHSSPEWLHCVLARFNEFLVDHAASERKASATCLSFVAKYRDKGDLVLKLIEVAREELEHFQNVCELLYSRSLMQGEDQKDVYAHRLLSLVRGDSNERLLDRLLISGVMEARGGERFALISEGLEDPELKAFYWKLARAEAKHQLFFVHLAETYFQKTVVEGRLNEILEEESRILAQLPIRPSLH